MRGVSRLLLPPYKSLRILLSPASVVMLRDAFYVCTYVPVLRIRVSTRTIGNVVIKVLQ